MPSQPQFVTSRLILQPLELGDFEDSAFREMGWSEIIHCIAPQNYRSQQVARRQGSWLRSSGRCPPPYENTPIEIWGQTREEWRARPAAR